MIVAGGTYYERCEFPYSKELWGPGLRGVAAIKEITPGENQLYTFIGEPSQTKLEMKGSAFNFTTQTIETPLPITFHYLHNHSNPELDQPSVRDLHKVLGPISDEAILRFGFVEGTAIVDGERVVYDPQSTDPEQFHQNGSKAEELALVLNQHEAKEYTGHGSLDEAIQSLTSGEDSADVAIVKCGASGALVQARGQTHEIPVYETDQVWNIGSGDIFSSIFSAYWAEQGYPAVEAAEQASLATAYYCSTRSLPIPENPLNVDGFCPEEKTPTIGEEGPTIYLAAPFFSIGEFWLVEEVRRILKAEGAEVVSPYHDIGRVENDEDFQSIVERDLTSIEGSDAILALIDDCDSGTFFELGYANHENKPVIGYKNNPDQRQYTMLEGSGCELYGDLSTAIFKTLWTK